VWGADYTLCEQEFRLDLWGSGGPGSRVYGSRFGHLDLLCSPQSLGFTVNFTVHGLGIWIYFALLKVSRNSVHRSFIF